mgnify:CR=1 FL=1
MTVKKSFPGLSGNTIKLLAARAMLCDHVGMIFFPRVGTFRAIGRIAFPLFAFMIAEGSAHTRNMRRYLGRLALIALISQFIFLVAVPTFRQCVMVTFSLSILLILSIQNLKERKTPLAICLFFGISALVFFLCVVLPHILADIDFAIDYGLIGVLLPVVIRLLPNRTSRLFSVAALLCLLAVTDSTIQWFALLALPILFLYNGQRGKTNLKWFFYLFYPIHLTLLYLIREIVVRFA